MTLASVFYSQYEINSQNFLNFQVAQWKHLDLCCLNPQDWGWKMEDGILTPIKTDLDPAPEWLLQVVRCKCKMSTKHPCGTLSCSCRKNGLTCVTACGSCHGEDCENSAKPISELDDRDNDDATDIFEIL